MCCACDMVLSMPTRMIQIRNVPDQVHREVKARAARARMSMYDYLRREIERLVEAPPIEEVLARLAARSRPRLSRSPAAVVRAERDAR